MRPFNRRPDARGSSGEYELCRAKKADIFVAIPVGVLE